LIKAHGPGLQALGKGDSQSDRYPPVIGWISTPKESFLVPLDVSDSTFFSKPGRLTHKSADWQQTNGLHRASQASIGRRTKASVNSRESHRHLDQRAK
jgi:hypothetical protein